MNTKQAIVRELEISAQEIADSICAYCGQPITVERVGFAVRSDSDLPWAHLGCWIRHIYGTYEEDGHEWINAPGACSECCAGQRGELNRQYGQGHFACYSVRDDILSADAAGEISGMYHGNSWRWY